jgi:DNA-binding transcriptional regulator YiaG
MGHGHYPGERSQRLRQNIRDGASRLIKRPLSQLALMVRQLREKTRLTQPQLAAGLGVRRGAVARWELGTREPGKMSLMALSILAAKKHFPELSLFFAREGHQRKLAANRADAKELLIGELHFAEYMAAAGDEEYRRLVDLSRLDPVDYGRTVAEKIAALPKDLGAAATGAESLQIISEARNVEDLRAARELRNGHALEDLRREASSRHKTAGGAAHGGKRSRRKPKK